MTTQTNLMITPQTKTSPLTGMGLNNGKNGAQIGGLGGSLSFIDMIFAQITAGSEAATQTKIDGDDAMLKNGMTQQTIINASPTPINADTTLTATDNIDAAGMLINDAPLSEEAIAFLESLANAIQGTDTNIIDPATSADDIPTPLQESAATLADLSPDQSKNLLARLESLLRGMPQGKQSIALGKIDIAIDTNTLSVDANTIKTAQDALIATGLTPEDITNLVQDIHDGHDLTNNTEGLAILAVIVNILPNNGNSAQKKSNDSILMPRPGQINSGAMPSAQAQTTTDIQSPSALEKFEGTLDTLLSDADADTSAGGKTKGFDQILRLMEAAQSNGNSKMAAGLEKAMAAVQAGTNPTTAISSALGGDFMSLMGGLLDGSSLDGLFPDGSEWARTINGINGLNVTGTASLTSLVTSTANSAASHPATQAVAVALTKNAQTGSDNSLSMRLDPPDLGKLEIHMRFSKDKSMKAHMIIEKPETLLMLQRDSSVLERSLQEAGIDTGNGGLSFELADQSHDWGRDGNGRGYEGGNGHKDNGGEADEEIVIESTMTWYTDAATGAQRYNILA